MKDWIEWDYSNDDGPDLPWDTLVETVLISGRKCDAKRVSNLRWTKRNTGYDITHYRIHKPETCKPSFAHDEESTADKIDKVCSDLAAFLKEKNEAYGDSALNPCRIFAGDVEPDAQLRVRIDDKLNRLIQGKEYVGDNDVVDLAGYLILLLVMQEWTNDQT